MIRYRHQAARQRIESEQSERKKLLNSKIDKRLDNFSEDIAKAVSSQLIAQMRPVYLAWYQNGGSLGEVEKKVRQICNEFAPARIVEHQAIQVKQEVTQITVDFVGAWLREHGVRSSNERVALVLSEAPP